MKKGSAYKLKNPTKTSRNNHEGFECLCSNPRFLSEDNELAIFKSDDEYNRFVNDVFVYTGTKENIVHEFYSVGSGHKYYILTGDLNDDLDKFEGHK